jgi:hypothetical protein
VLLRIVVCVIDPDDHREVCAFARSRYQDLARTTFQVQRRVVAAAELAGGLDHHVRAEVAPADGRRLANAEGGDGLTVDDYRTVGVRDIGREPALGGVEGEQMSVRASVMSLMATTSRSSISRLRRTNVRPIRPKPLMPIRIGTIVLLS